MRVFTKEENNYLEARYPAEGASGVAKHLNCTGGTIIRQARRLGLSRESKYPSRTLSGWERGYLAGIIDGEGCVSFRGKTRKDGKHPVFRFQLSIDNTDKRIVHMAGEIIGCSPVSRRRYGKYKGICWRLRAGKEVISWLFPQLRLIGKEDQRLLLLEALEIFNNGKDLAKLETIADKVHKLNQRTRIQREEYYENIPLSRTS